MRLNSLLGSCGLEDRTRLHICCTNGIKNRCFAFRDDVVAAISLLADSSFPFAALYLHVLVLVVWGSQFYVVLFIFTSLVWFCSLAFWWPFVLLVHLPLMNKILPISKINKSISLLGQPLKLTMLYAKNK
jgi:hypothetical protein